jgi:hypothetical protein
MAPAAAIHIQSANAQTTGQARRRGRATTWRTNEIELDIPETATGERR